MKMKKKEPAINEKKNYDRLVKILQIASAVFMLAMLVTFVLIMKKNNISVKNPEALAAFFKGNVITVALMIILFNLIKSFALVVTPSIVFVVSGIIFREYGVNGILIAIAVNFIAVAIGQIPPYFLGKFTGSSMVNTLRKRFPKVKKIDDFAGQNEFVLSFIVKASGLIPGDTASLILGAMNISFKNFYIGSMLGTLPINIMWAILGNRGDFSNPYTLLYLLPIILFVLLMSFIAKQVTSKKAAEKNTETE